MTAVRTSVAEFLTSARTTGRAGMLLLIDPDKVSFDTLPGFIAEADAAGVDGYLVGGSLVLLPLLEQTIRAIKSITSRPVIIFPGGVHQISGEADALLFLSIISGRNADQLIGQHVIAAPIIRRLGLEAVSTGYMIIASDQVTTTEFMSHSKPIPRTKPEIAMAHAMAAELLGMRLVYLEAGSGASQPVPETMVHAVARSVSLPVIVGGGIRTPDAAAARVAAGASIIVVGNHFEKEEHRPQLTEFAAAIHAAGIAHPIAV